MLGLNEALPEGKQLVGNAGSAGPTRHGRRRRVRRARRAIGASARSTRARGSELWSATLANNANANPMSYAGRSGKQRVAIIAGDTVNVFALP